MSEEVKKAVAEITASLKGLGRIDLQVIKGGTDFLKTRQLLEDAENAENAKKQEAEKGEQEE